MSTTNPPEGPNGPEYLEQGGGDAVPPSSGDSSGKGRRTALLAGGAVVLLAAAGAGTWAAVSFLGSGSQPTEALPSGTLAYVSVDLDPSGSQKIEAFRMLEKFPAIKEELGGFDAEDDIRRKIFEQAECEGLSYDDDVAPWMGTSFAVAAVDAGEEQPSPVGVLQVTDQGAAEDGLAKLAECEGEDSTSGYVVEGDWAIVAETEKIAQSVVDATGEGTLADDSTHQDWMARVGDQGVVDMYASPEAGPVLAEAVAGEFGAQGASLSSDDSGSGVETAAQVPEPEVPEEFLQAFDDFKGAAGTVRFADGGVEVEFAADVPEGAMMTLPTTEGANVDVVGTLPAETAFAYAAALPEGWAQSLLDTLPDYGIPQEQIDQGLAQAEAQTGLSLPEDIETLLGEQFALAFGGDFDIEQLVNSGDPTGLPVGLKVQGDAAGINSVMDTLGQASGMPEWFETETDGDTVAWSLNPDYRSSLAGDGGLADSDTFRGVVPDADKASNLMYVDFDAGDWLTNLSESDPEAEANLEPLSALGISSWVDGGTTHGKLRLTTD